MSLLEQDADGLELGLARLEKRCEDDLGDHEDRLRVLERVGFRMTAYAALGGGMGAAIVSGIVSALFGRHL